MPTTPALSRSAKLYQERKQPGHRTTRRSPAFYHNFRINPARHLPLEPPYPIDDVLQVQGGNDRDCCDAFETDGSHPPDGALTAPWPHGTEEIS